MTPEQMGLYALMYIIIVGIVIAEILEIKYGRKSANITD